MRLFTDRMTRASRRPAGALPSALAGLLILACAAPGAPPLNVVLVIIDDLGWADTGVYGSTFYDTPNIDRLASQGVRFTQFYTASPVCSPTRASLMTGKHPARLDLTNWIGGEQNGLLRQAAYVRQLPLEEVTMGEAFEAAGYVTGYIGKWHLGEDGYLPPQQGFDWTFAVNRAGQPGAYFPPYENPGWAITNVPDLEGDPPGSYLTDRLTDASIDFLNAYADTSFFLVLSHYAVHTPLQAKEAMEAEYEARSDALGEATDADYRSEHDAETKLRQDHATYAAMIRSVDESVGRVMGRIDELGIGDRTAVLFVSDNGGLSTLPRRGFNQATSNEPLRAGKGWLYEGGIRAPLIVKWPSAGAQGALVETPAISMDLYPTLLAMAGLPRQSEQTVDGMDLSGLLRDQATALSRDTLYWHFPHYHGSGNRPSAAIRAGDWKLVHWFEDGSRELYDLGADPSETADLSALHPDVADSLDRSLLRWLASIDANMPTPMEQAEGSPDSANRAGADSGTHE